MFKGKIKAYSEEVNASVIEGVDGRHYNFHASEWSCSETRPSSNVDVTFEAGMLSARKVMRS